VLFRSLIGKSEAWIDFLVQPNSFLDPWRRSGFHAFIASLEDSPQAIKLMSHCLLYFFSLLAGTVLSKNYSLISDYIKNLLENQMSCEPHHKFLVNKALATVCARLMYTKIVIPVPIQCCLLIHVASTVKDMNIKIFMNEGSIYYRNWRDALVHRVEQYAEQNNCFQVVLSVYKNVECLFTVLDEMKKIECLKSLGYLLLAEMDGFFVNNCRIKKRLLEENYGSDQASECTNIDELYFLCESNGRRKRRILEQKRKTTKRMTLEVADENKEKAGQFSILARCLPTTDEPDELCF